MEKTIYEFLLDIPQAVANFGQWLLKPINNTWLNISPLGLFGIGGTTIILAIITVHIVKLFI